MTVSLENKPPPSHGTNLRWLTIAKPFTHAYHTFAFVDPSEVPQRRPHHGPSWTRIRKWPFLFQLPRWNCFPLKKAFVLESVSSSNNFVFSLWTETHSDDEWYPRQLELVTQGPLGGQDRQVDWEKHNSQPNWGHAPPSSRQPRAEKGPPRRTPCRWGPHLRAGI